jgi:hypothetical protein
MDMTMTNLHPAILKKHVSPTGTDNILLDSRLCIANIPCKERGEIELERGRKSYFDEVQY